MCITFKYNIQFDIFKYNYNLYCVYIVILLCFITKLLVQQIFLSNFNYL